MDNRDSDVPVRREIPSYLEPAPPLINNPFMRPRPEKGINLLDKFEEISDTEDPESDLVQVYLRLKPCKTANSIYEVRSDTCLVTSLDTATAGHGRRTQHNIAKSYSFTRIFKPECSQKEIFEAVVKDNLKKLADGQSFTLLTYGASGSGKTYTVMGTVEEPGLVPRALEYLFKVVDAAQTPIFKPSDNGADRLKQAQQNYELQWVKRIQQISAPYRDKYRRMSGQLHSDLTVSNVDLANRTKYYIWVSFVEIYNENIYDLLAPTDKRLKLRMREDSTGNVYVKGVIQAFVRTGEEAYNVMVAGKQNLMIAETGIHAHSSRSHSVFTITMLTENNGEIRTSHVRLCDLAGCERQNAAKNTGARMKESRAINSSLHVLERCLHMLRRKQRLTTSSCMVPYRESKLTRLLGAGLSGERGEAVSMVVTLNTAPEHTGEAKHVLSLASVARDIQVNVTMATTFASLESYQQDSTTCSSDELMRLRTENERLHFELLQAQSCIAEFEESMYKKQQETAATMSEIVANTRESTQLFYERRLAAKESEIDELKAEKEEIIDDYENKLADAEEQISRLKRKLQKRKSYFLKEYLRGSNNEGHESLHNEQEMSMSNIAQSSEGTVDLADSDNDKSEETDGFEESLEPSHRQNMKGIDKARISFILQRDPPGSDIIDLDESDEEKYENDFIRGDDENAAYEHKKSEARKNNSNHEVEDNSEVLNDKSKANNLDQSETNEDNISSKESNSNEDTTSKDSLYATGDEDSEVENETKDNDMRDLTGNITQTTYERDIKKASVDAEEYDMDNFETDKSMSEALFRLSTRLDETQDSSVNVPRSTARGTYFVKSTQEEIKHMELPKVNALRGTYFVSDRKESFYKPVDVTNDSVRNMKPPETNQKSAANKPPTTEFVKPTSVSQAAMSKLLKSVTTRQSSISSLQQFERLESAVKDIMSPESVEQLNMSTAQLPKFNKKKNYFDDSMLVEVSNTTNSAAETTPSDTVINSDDIKNTSEKVKPDTMNEIHVLSSSNISFLSDAAKRQENVLNQKSNDTSICSNNEEAVTSATSTNNNFLTPKVKQRTLYFDKSDKVVYKDVLISKSPTLESDNVPEYEPSAAVKKVLGEDFAKPEKLAISARKDGSQKHVSCDIFESPQVSVATKSKEIVELLNEDSTAETVPFPNVKENALEIARQFIEGIQEMQQLNTKVKKEPVNLERTSIHEASIKSIPNKGAVETEPICNVKIKVEQLDSTQISNNTIDEYENIVKDLTHLRATEFDLLVSSNNTTDPKTTPTNLVIDSSVNEKNKLEILNQNQKLEISNEINTLNMSNERKNLDISNEKHNTEMSDRTKKFEEVKYNLRNRGNFNLYTSEDKKGNEEKNVEGAKTISRRALRLRRRLNQKNDSSDQDDNNLKDNNKLKDIMNLEKEFSDVTLGLPAATKVVNDIPSPEKLPDEVENMPPMMGIQSCPSKSVTRSRRKLFTPRAEPLEESPYQGDSNERVHIPRPCYHKSRVRRKL